MPIAYEQFMTASLRRAAWGERVGRVLAAAVNAADPAQAVRAALTRQGDVLHAGGQAYDLRKIRQVYLTGCGKAGAPMAQAAAEVLGDSLQAGVVIVKEGHVGQAGPALAGRGVEVIEAGHPIPDKRGINATRRLEAVLDEAGPDDLVVHLISGGGSALMVAPVPGIQLADIQALTGMLLKRGAGIQEINTIRKHLDLIKGGGLARRAAPAALLTLILSDVVGDPLDMIASGPTVPDTTSFADAWNVLQAYDLLDESSPAIRSHFEHGLRGDLPDTPGPDDPIFERVFNVLVGSNRKAAQAAAAQARQEGMQALLLTTHLQGEARQVGRVAAALASSLAIHEEPLKKPACLVLGGETTVTVTGRGKGGRNQELALGAVLDLDGLENTVVVSLATDGGDGPTDAAGAVASGETNQRALQAGMDPLHYLADNNAYAFFEKLGDLLKPGPTMTNVNDLILVFCF